ncbi:MAG: hypothetical protein Q9224_005461, partial [Gallowayella concinna]
MDPLSVIAGVLGIAAVVAQSSKGLFELIDAIRSAPNEIKNISRDTHAFYNILYSLESSLKDPRITAVVAEDDALTALIGNLRMPLGNCSSVLGQLMVKIQGFVRPLDGERYRMSSNDWKWYFGRKEVLELTARVEACKGTLDTGLTAIGTLCSVRLMAAGGVVSGKPLRRASGDTDAGFALRRYAEERDTISQYASSIRPPSPPSEAFSASMRLDQTSTTLQGTDSGSSEPVVDKLERLRRAENQRDALINAVKQGDDLLLELAIEEGANVNAKGADGKAPLHLAALQGNPDIVQLLIDHHANPNISASIRGDRMERKFEGSRTPLHWACHKGHESCVRILVDNKGDVNARNCTSRYPLQEAIMHGHTNIANLLLESGALLTISDNEGWTPLHQAADNGNVELINTLLDRGCDIEARTTDKSHLNRYCRATPLFLAAGTGKEAAAKALLDRGADPRCRNITGEMPIHVACWRGFAPVVRLMLDAGIDIEERDVDLDETPLLKAASTGQPHVLKLLLDRGADMNAMNPHGRNALVHCQLHRKDGNEEAVDFLKGEYKRKEERDRIEKEQERKKNIVTPYYQESLEAWRKARVGNDGFSERDEPLALTKTWEEEQRARRKSTNEDLEAMRIKALEKVLEEGREASRKKSQEQDRSPEVFIHRASFRNDIINAARLQEMDSSSSD